MQFVKYSQKSTQKLAAVIAVAGAIALGVSFVGASASAADSSSQTAASNSGTTNVTQTSVASQVEQAKEKAAIKKHDVDKEITNNEMRAMSGSKSPVSVSTSFSYQGGALSSPLAENRPDISGVPTTTQKSALSGSVAVKLNLNEANSLSAGTGLRFVAPLQGGPHGNNYHGQTFDFQDPYIQYQNIAKVLGVQSVLQAGVAQFTASDITPLGYAQELSLSEDAIYAVGHLSLGMYVGASYNTFDKHASDLRASQNDYSFGLDPFLEYQITKKVNFRTVADAWAFDHYLPQSPTTYSEETYIQSVGIGLSVSRNVFLYPNFQFIPEHIAMNQTNVGLDAYVNAF